MASSKLIAKTSTPETGLKVHSRCFTVNLGGGDDSDERFSRDDDLDSSWTVEGLEIRSRYPDVTVPAIVAPGDTVYLVYVVYSTGDSLSRHYNGSMTYIDCFTTAAKAEAAANRIRDHDEWASRGTGASRSKRGIKTDNCDFSEKRTVDIVREDGTLLSVYASWNGYFESLSYVECQPFTIS